MKGYLPDLKNARTACQCVVACSVLLYEKEISIIGASMVERRLGELAAAFYTRQLPEEYKRFDNPHIYKVGLGDRLKCERDTLMTKHQEEAA